MLDTKQGLAAGGDHVGRASIVAKSIEGDLLSAFGGGGTSLAAASFLYPFLKLGFFGLLHLHIRTCIRTYIYI